MKTFRVALIAVSAFSTLTLAACGDGWDMVQIRDQVPYTDERTAGPGIAYVRAHMMPEKSVVLPAAPMMDAPKSAEPIFEKKMEKK